MKLNKQKQVVYLALGTNLEDKAKNLQQAQEEITAKIGSVSAASSVYETEPWGYQSPNPFFNQVVQVETTLPPLRLLQEAKKIEKRMGRPVKASDVYCDRIIDIDLILYNDLILNLPHLIIPHPRFHERKFVLEPLNEIAPDLIHPILKKPIKEFLT